MSCFIHPDGLAKPRLPAGAPRNMWLANRTLGNMNAGGRAIPVALTQQHIVMFKTCSPDLIWPTIVYRLVAVSLFATFALFCLQLLSIVSFGCE